MNKISTFSKSKKYSSIEKGVKKVAKNILNILNVKRTHIEFFLISDSEIKKINSKYRNKNSETNVLSFCEPKGFLRRDKDNFLGEIYLAPDFIKKNKQSINQMIAHGILHLLGYDHIRKLDAEKMEKKENDILKRLETRD